MSVGTLVVGASQAGLQVAVSLRAHGDQGPITLVGAEPHLPYERPPLSKAFLSGAVELPSLAFRTQAFYDEHGIAVVTADRVQSLQLSVEGPPGSGTAQTASGRHLGFAKLALTVGAAPRRIFVPGAELDGVCYLRDVDDALRLRTELARARSVVIIGGGFIGLEVAAIARAQGKSVIIVESADRLIARAVAPVVSEFYRQAHARHGTIVHLGRAVTAFGGRSGRVTDVILADGTHLPADIVVVGVGIVPRIDLAEQLGLNCASGIVVDEYARTSISTIVAAGDCTILPNPLTGDGRVRLESVQNAVGQAQVAAATLAGQLAPYAAVPWFWSDQYHLKLQIAGLSAGYDDAVVRGEPASERFSVLYYRDGQLLAVDAVNAPADYLTVRKALSQGATIPADLARDSGTALKGLLVPRTPLR